MRPKNPYRVFGVAALLAAFLALPVAGLAGEAAQEWEVINPAGTIAIKGINPAPRPATLDGKTIVLRWNSKHNGDNYLNRIAELFAEKVPSARVVKLYEIDKSTIRTSGSNQESARIAGVIKGLKPDLVIGSQAD
ncbi:MAG: hypothetical protein H6Q44_829 [Deltaproteobacteria bacterium]|jgi:hypothetical protein|nr:hypothetical protein [Deltaproteobacteria bacterium]